MTKFIYAIALALMVPVVVPDAPRSPNLIATESKWEVEGLVYNSWHIQPDGKWMTMLCQKGYVGMRLKDMKNGQLTEDQMKLFRTLLPEKGLVAGKKSEGVPPTYVVQYGTGIRCEIHGLPAYSSTVCKTCKRPHVSLREHINKHLPEASSVSALLDFIVEVCREEEKK